MKNRLILLALICTSTLFAAKPEKVSIEYAYQSNDKSESLEKVTLHAFEKAKQRVLETTCLCVSHLPWQVHFAFI